MATNFVERDEKFEEKIGKRRERSRAREIEDDPLFFLRDWFLPPSAAIEVREDN